MIRIVPPDDYGPLDDACARAGEFDWIVFASANAVDAFMERLLAGRRRTCARSSGVKLCGVGPATAERLARYGLKVDLTPAEYRAEAVLQALSETRRRRGPEDAAAARRHRPRAARRRAAQARRRGHRGRRLPHRRRRSRSAKANPTSTACCSSGSIDVVTFTSPSAVRNFVRVARRRAGGRPAARRRSSPRSDR